MGGWTKRPRSLGLSAFRFGFGLINSNESIYTKIFIRFADMLANEYNGFDLLTYQQMDLIRFLFRLLTCWQMGIFPNILIC